MSRLCGNALTYPVEAFSFGTLFYFLYTECLFICKIDDEAFKNNFINY
jgi:hypothetical protein